MSAKDQIKQIVDYFKREPQLKDKTDGMAEGLMLGANLADEANERSKDAAETTLAVQEKYKEQILTQDLNPNKDPELVDIRDGSATAGERIRKFEQETNRQLVEIVQDVDRRGVDVRKFGFVGDNLSDDRQPLIDAIEYAISNKINKVIVPPSNPYLSDTVFLPNNIEIEGAGSELTIFDMKDSNNTVFKTVQNSTVTLSQTNDVLHGHNENTITNTLKIGDFIRYKSSKRFTAPWDNGKEIRSYYNNAELFEIKERTETSVTFTHPSFLDMPATQTLNVEAFTPTENITLSGFTVRRNRTTIGYNKGIHIVQAKNVRLKDIKTENFNDSGIIIDRSMDVYAEDLKHVGGITQESSGTNYGIFVADGSKNVTINKISSKEVRHTVVGGGTGWGISMYVHVNNISSEDSLSHSLDTHGGTAFFTYSNAVVDNGMSISGIGHTVENIKSVAGKLLPYEGGMNITFRNIKYDSLTDMYTNNILLDVLLENVDINITHDLPFRNNLHRDSKRITYRNFKLKRVGYGIKTTLADLDALFEADGSSHYGISVLEGFVLDNVTIEGFPIPLYLNGKNAYVGKIKLVNCGWTTSLSTYDSLIVISKNGEYSTIDNIRYKNDSVSSYTFNARTINFITIGTGSGKQISVSDVKKSPDSTISTYWGVTIPVDFTNLFLFNNEIHFGGGGNSISGTGKFIKNNFVADN